MYTEKVKQELFTFLDKTLNYLDRHQKKLSDKKEEFTQGNYAVVNDLLSGTDASELGYIDTLPIYTECFEYLMLVYKSVNTGSIDIEKTLNDNLTKCKTQLQRYMTAQSVILDVDAEKRFVSKSLPRVNNNVDVISARDWFTVSYIKYTINALNEVIDIYKDVLAIIGTGKKAKRWERREVPLSTFDELCAEYGIEFVKDETGNNKHTLTITDDNGENPVEFDLDSDEDCNKLFERMFGPPPPIN